MFAIDAGSKERSDALLRQQGGGKAQIGAGRVVQRQHNAAAEAVDVGVARSRKNKALHDREDKRGAVEARNLHAWRYVKEPVTSTAGHRLVQKERSLSCSLLVHSSSRSALQKQLQILPMQQSVYQGLGANAYK
jgi:hypothetical protein